MKKKQLVKPDKSKGNVAKPLCGTYAGQSCTLNGNTGAENDILL